MTIQYSTHLRCSSSYVRGVEGGEEGQESHHGVTKQQHQGKQSVLKKGFFLIKSLKLKVYY